MYLIISITIIIISYFMFKKVSLSKNFELLDLNWISYVYYIDLIIFSCVGSLFIVYKIDNSFVLSWAEVSDKSRIMTWVTTNYILLTLPLGIFIGEKLLGKSRKYLLEKYRNKEIKPIFESKKYSIHMLNSLLLLSLGMTYYIIKNLKVSPLIMMVLGSSSGVLDQARYYADVSFSGFNRIIDVNKVLSPIIFLALYVNRKIIKTKTNNITIIIAGINTIICLFYKLEKASIPIIILSVLMLLTYLGTLKKKTIIKVSIVIILWLMVMFFLTRGTSTISEIFSLKNGMLGRIFIQQIQGLTVHFQIFPKQQSFMGISNILGSTVANIFNIEYSETSSRIINEIAFGSRVAKDTYGVMNTIFAGEAYAAFGLIGLILSPIIVGFTIGFKYVLLLKIPKNPLFLAVLSYFSANTFITGNFGYFLYNPNLILVLSILLFVYLLYYYPYMFLKYKMEKSNICIN